MSFINLSVVVIAHLALFATQHGALHNFGVYRSRPLYFPASICLADRGAHNIYHFFIFSLGGLYMYERPGYSVVTHTLFPVDLSFQREALALLAPEFVFREDVPKEIVHRCPKVTPAFVDYSWCTLEDRWLPSLTRGCEFVYGATLPDPNVLDRVDPAAHLFLRDFFRRKLNDRGLLPAGTLTDCIYIIRHTAGVRQIVNEIDLIPGFLLRHFTLVTLEDFAVLEKLRIFANARVVVSTQSAGAVFTAVMDSRALFVEIFPEFAPHPLLQLVNIAADVGVPVLRYTAADVVASNHSLAGAYGIFNLRVRSPEAFFVWLDKALEDTQKRAAGPIVSTTHTPSASASETPWAA